MPSSGIPAWAASRSQSALRSLHSARSVTNAAEPVTMVAAKPWRAGRR